MEENTVVNVTTSIIESINHIFSNIFSAVDNGIYEILDKITFIDTEIVEKDSFVSLFGSSPSSGMLLVCNSLILGIFLFYIATYLFSHITYTKVQAPLPFIFKAIIFIALMNNSLWICKEMINIISLISGSICEIGKSLFGEDISFVHFITKINDKIYTSKEVELDVTSFDGIIKTFTTFGFMNLIFSYALRYIMVQVFVLLFPFAMLCAIYDKTAWIFKSLMKAFISLLLEQVLVALILVLAFSFSFSPSNDLSKVLYIGIIYSLMKANTYMYMILGGISTSITNNVNMLSSKGGQ